MNVWQKTNGDNSNKSPTRYNNFPSFITLTFIYSSTCFGRSHAHHLELNNCSSSLWFLPSYLDDSRAVVRVRPEHEQQHGYHHDTKVKPEAAAAVF